MLSSDDIQVLTEAREHLDKYTILMEEIQITLASNRMKKPLQGAIEKVFLLMGKLNLIIQRYK